MNNKYFEHIIIYLSVAIVCFAIALIARIMLVSKGVDAFSANTVFVLVAGLGFLLYCILTVVVQEMLDKKIMLFFPKLKRNIKKQETVKLPTLNEIRTEKQKELEQRQDERIDSFILYTQKVFALYISNNDMESLCNYIKMYAEGNNFENMPIEPIRINELTTIDICHFGWNLWNHFNTTDQWAVSQFLKKVFEEKLEDIELKTIKKKLKIFDTKCVIQIQEDITIENIQ